MVLGLRRRWAERTITEGENRDERKKIRRDYSDQADDDTGEG